jgi:hypothetical protein
MRLYTRQNTLFGPVGILAATLASCQSPSAPLPEAATQAFCDDFLGVAFEVPAGWQHEEREGKHRFSGPPNDDTQYLTIALQEIQAPPPVANANANAGQAPRPPALDTALDAAYASISGTRRFVWNRREPATCAGEPALWYDVSFELYEKPRRKIGVLMASPAGLLLDLCFGANSELFWTGVPAFDRTVSSLRFY